MADNLLSCFLSSPAYGTCSYVGYLFFQLKTHADYFQVSSACSAGMC